MAGAKFNPLVSIVIPVYNGANYLKEAIDSAIAQTYKNIEILVINDGSKDNGATEKIAKSYGDKIRYFHKKNGGVATALNLGIKEMKGEYFSWLSHDDMYYPYKIDKQIEMLRGLDDKKVVLFSDYEIINEESKNVTFISQDHQMLQNKPEYALLRGCVNGITLLIPKSAFNEIGGFDPSLKCTQDYDLWRRISTKYEFLHMTDYLSKTRAHPLQDSINHPNVVSEGNDLWINMMKGTTSKKRVALEGSEYSFYLKMYLHLKKSLYTEAAEYANNKADSVYLKAKEKLGGAEPLISVIIPCYNQGKYVNDAVRSVLNQTYTNFEIIIVNDGSTDQYTNDLLSNYDEKKTVVYTTTNQGLSSARNFGTSKSNGDLIQYLDADDYLGSRKFEYQSRVFVTNQDIDVCYTNYRYFFEKDEEYKPPFHGVILGDNPREDFLYRWQRSLSIPIHSPLFKKSIFNNSQPFISGMKAVEDWIMWVDISNRGARFEYIDDELATYRIQEKSTTLNGARMFYWAARAISYIAEHYITKQESDRYDLTQQDYLKYLADYLLIDESKKTSKDSIVYENMPTFMVRYIKSTLPYKAARMLRREGPRATLGAVVGKVTKKGSK